ncbi:hypothetical protein AAFC00_004567 [Neodothiora populina]|uniref:Rab-GAP TBC domain-containing protein n=1 Tax=Neodothiora populina TaxID=2781224 RepID=A0ABR3P2F6_9PEZI
MREFKEARAGWSRFLTYPALSDLKIAIRNDGEKPSPLVASRSLCWKAFLLFEDSSREEWLRRLSDSRSAYASVRTHLLKALEHPEEVGSGFDPLSDGTESPWAVLRQDETLRAEILQDVDRCMPENMYFRQPEAQRKLLDVLFVFCKLNPDVSYRQGMHELLAPILWVVESDAISDKPTGMLSSDDQMLCQMCDSQFIEHDSFTLFGIIMQGAKSFYEQAAHSATSLVSTTPAKPTATLENPIITRIHRIFDEYLPHIDPRLSQHLRDIDLIPQVFLMKWIRLLFGREFPFDDVLSMWDVIFAEDPTLEIVDLICLVMIVRLHWELLESDYNTALTVLLRYPAPQAPTAPQAFVLDAIYLRDHLHQAGASHIIEKYSDRPLADVNANNETTLPVSTSSVQSMLGSRLSAVGLAPKSPGRQAGNIDRVFQDAAKGLFKRGEQWGINKAVRDALVEVQKGVREIQNVPTPQRPRTHMRTSSRQSGSGERAVAKLAALEARNVALAKMLKNATDDLWKYHEEAVAGKGSEKERLDALSIAIARVQFTQVYLEDSTVPLPADEEQSEEQPKEELDGASAPGDVNGRTKESSVPPPVGTRAPDACSAPPPPPSKSRPRTKKSSVSSVTNGGLDAPVDFQTPRPSLTQSSFSWMLGQDSSASSFVQAQPLPPSDARRRSRGFLFGDDEHSSSVIDQHDTSKSKITNKLRKKRPESTSKVQPEILFEQESEVWDLGQLEEEDKKKKEQDAEKQRKAAGKTDEASGTIFDAKSATKSGGT